MRSLNYLAAVDDWFFDVHGGMARVAMDAAFLMRDQGCEVSLLCAKPAAKRSLPDVEESHGIRIVRYERPVLPGWHPRRATHMVNAASQAALAHLRDRKWDVIHMHSPFTGLGAVKAFAPGPRLAYTMHSPLVMEQQINWKHQGFAGKVKLVLGQGSLKRLEGGLLRQCDVIQTLSQFTRTQLDRFYGLGSRSTVIPHWRRPELFRQHGKQDARDLLGWRQDEKILFTVRNLGPRNGLDVGIRSVAPAARRGACRFMIAGRGSLRPQLEALVGELGASERITFLGSVSDEQLYLAYQAADLFLLPTLTLECFGLILQEAFSFGCPVLSTDAGAIPEIMTPIMPDFVVEAGNVEALREKLEAFLDGVLEPPSPEQLVSYMRERFDCSLIAPALLELLGLSASSQREEAFLDSQV